MPQADTKSGPSQSGLNDRQPTTPPEPPSDAAALIEENATLRDRLLRALAETENVRRRSERAVDDARQYGISDLARELLVVGDNLRRTIAAVKPHDSDAAFDRALVEGVQATERVLAKTLEQFGVRRVQAAGEDFNPELHEAVMEVGDATRSPGTVAEVLEDGYTIGGRLLRPARVTVTRSPTSAPAPSGEAPNATSQSS